MQYCEGHKDRIERAISYYASQKIPFAKMAAQAGARRVIDWDYKTRSCMSRTEKY
jgi:hypothetical protein